MKNLLLISAMVFSLGMICSCGTETKKSSTDSTTTDTTVVDTVGTDSTVVDSACVK
jgi:hypothetical protein